VITRRALDMPETQAGLRPVCLATPVRYVMKQDTRGGSIKHLVNRPSQIDHLGT
jgi:hypothetical protein